ncbi:terpene synthase family protein [Catellatospora sp. NPDC049609]|uniref:terpene synthase family protein n=1 Tax=Catellatospora sp. NPDC049609 TaxID=3155505 RepID=UPI00344185BA
MTALGASATVRPYPTSENLLPNLGFEVSDDIHPDADRIGAHLQDWAKRVGLASSPHKLARQFDASFERVAARIFPALPRRDVQLYAQWVVWLFVLDDEQDEGFMGRSVTEVDEAFAELTAVVDGYMPPREAAPVALVLAELWSRTTLQMSQTWRARFLQNFRRYHAAFRAQAAHRFHGTVPSLEDYPELRRYDNAMFMFDLVEVAHRTEVPPSLANSDAWREMHAASSDITAWCNDLVSLNRDSAQGEQWNYVAVYQSATGCSQATAIRTVRNHIRARSVDLVATKNRVVAHIADCPNVENVMAVANTVCAIPGAHYAWLRESGRHTNQAH